MNFDQPRLISPNLVAALLLGAPVAIFVAMFTAQLDNGVSIGRMGSIYGIGLLAYAIAAYAMLYYTRRHTRLLARLALIDSLSGLRNRRALHLDAAHDVPAGTELAVAVLDLDGFKSVNDFYGHSVGDRVIQECASQFSALCGEVGVVYRLGGDEFAIVASGPLAGTILEGLCRRLQVRLAEPFMVEGRSIMLGTSIGLARGLAGGRKASSALLRQADVAMYVAKARGKGRVTWFNEEFDRDRALLQQMDVDLQKALKDGELLLHYQPLIESSTGQIGAVEALLRWERPDGKRIGPDIFIPVAEETGLVEPIGLWVLRQACTDGSHWDKIKVSVNVSVVQLRNAQFPLQLGQILEETGFPAERLELEITETLLVGDPVIAGRNLEMLRDFGVGIVLDDYGTGYASIGFLRRFRFEKLKLDRSLIIDAAGDAATRTVMAASVTMAKALGMQVTAEGIETEIQATLARTAGCDQMQGWLYSKAVSAPEIAQLLAAQAAGVDPVEALSVHTKPRRVKSAQG